MNKKHKKGYVGNPLVILREEFDERAILFNPETGATFSVNAIGALIWKYLDGHHSLDDLATLVREKSAGVPPDVKCHIETFVQSAVDLGLAEYIVE